MPLFRNIDAWSRRFLGCDAVFVGAVAAAQLWLGLLWFFYWGHGIARAIILLVLLAGLVALRFRPGANSAGEPAGASRLPTFLKIILIVVLLIDVAIMAVSDITSLRTASIPMDEGQTSWRAARLLWRGENPYGYGTLLDFAPFEERVRERQSLGIPTTGSGQNLLAALARYDASLDPGLRRQLLPAPPLVKANATTVREMHVYGYKYGPLILLLTALVGPTGIPAMVLFLNGLACFALYGINWRILQRVAGAEIALAGVAMAALLLDRHITRSFIGRSATDVWPLIFGSLAVLACMSKRPLAAAAAVALAVGCKTIPGFLFLPMLLRFRSPWPMLVFAIIAGAIYLPWVLWDAQGVFYDVFLWPFLAAKNSSSWEFFAPPAASLAARIVAVLLISVLWLRYILARETRLFWTLATSTTILLLASGNLGNNYIPWVSLWMVAAFVEAFAARQGVNSPSSTVA